MKKCSIFFLLLYVLAALYLRREFVFAQGSSKAEKKSSSGFEETAPKKENKPSPGFEQDQSALCLSATSNAKLVASIVENYSRRLGACSTSNLRNDCSAEFRGVVQSYNQYQLAASKVRNYCN